MEYFWTNSVWYLLLGLVTICELIFVLKKAKMKKFAFAYYLTLCGIEVVFFETIVFLTFRGYDYYPKIIVSSPMDDNLLGKVFSQLSVCATTLMVAVLDLNILWIVCLAGIYGLIEYLFLSLGIYRHNWYQTWFTVVFLTIAFLVLKKYYYRILKGAKPYEHYLNIFTGLFPMVVLTIMWAFSLSGVQRYVSDYFPYPDVYKIHMANIYFALLAVSMMLIYFFRLKWRWKLGVMLIFHSFTYLLYRINILWFKNGWWYLIFSISTILWVYFSVVLLDYLYKSPAKHIDSP